MPAIKAIEVRFQAVDVRRSADFYARTLGFEATTLWPCDAPAFAILGRDGLRLQLVQSEGEAAPSVASLWLDVTDIAGLHAAIQAITPIEWGPEVYVYGRREFAFRDPDGHAVILSEITADPLTCE